MGALGAAAAPALAVDPDVLTDNPGDGVTLREAITATPAGGTINLQPGTYQVSLGAGVGNYEDNNASGDLDITKAVTINGAGADQTIIQSTNPGPVDGVFHVRNSLSISNLTVTGGLRPLSPSAQEQRGFGAGGAFRVGSTGGEPGFLTATGVKIVGNQAFQGAAVFVSASAGTRSTASFIDSVISGNQASSYGGGISGYGDVTLNRTAIVGNKAAYGGGLFLWNNPRATLSATNTTIGGNIATQNGGGMQTGATVNLDFTTIAGNSAQGGRNIMFDGGSISTSNSIFAGAADNSCANLSTGDISSGGFNIDQGATCLGLDTTGDNQPDGPLTPDDRINVAEEQIALQPLNPATGIYYFNLGTGSAAIDSGPPLCFQATDQRKVARPQNGRCDVGAVEYTPPPPAQVVDVGIDSFAESVRPATVGQDLRYDAVVRNVASGTAQDVVLTTSVPATTSFVSMSANCTRPRQDSIRCTLGNLAPGQTATTQLTVKPTVPGTISNRADISTSAQTPDVNSGNNQARTSVDVVAGSGGPGGTTDKVSVRLLKSAKKSDKKISFRVTASRDGSATVTLRDSKRKKLASKTAKFTKAGTKTVSITVTKSLKTKLNKLKKGSKLTVVAVLHPPTGANVTKTAKLKLSTKRSIVKG